VSSDYKNKDFYQNIHQEIIDRCMAGDQKAQFQLYKLYYKAMYNTSLRIVNDNMEAEDIMQEAFLSAFEKIDTYQGMVSFGAWLKRIVINKSLDHIKKKSLDLNSIEEIPVDIPEEYDEYDEPGSMDEKEFKIEEIREAISRLPEKYRIVLSLYLLEGYDHDEISDILNINSSTSRSQLVRAKHRLITILKEDKYDGSTGK
jgi:RNA polymerase sigma-70 factor (ECF subfamily)